MVSCVPPVAVHAACGDALVAVWNQGVNTLIPICTVIALGAGHASRLLVTISALALVSGVVVGLLLLTPVFTHDLQAQETAAQNTGAQLVINAPLSLATKIGLGSRLQDTIGSGSPSRPPDIRPAFAPLGTTGDAPRLEAAIQDQIDRAVTHAFSRSFLFASLFALAALVPLGVRRLQ